jgi:hypothetical protein
VRSLVVTVAALMVVAPRAGAQQSWRDWMPSLPGTPRSAEHEAARRMMPVAIALAPSGRRALATRALKVRVYAADDYQHQTFDWQQRFRRLVERINADCAAWPGVRFVVSETRPWPHESSARAMEALVDDLVQLDPGDDVDVVIGLVAAIPAIPTSVDLSGMARIMSKHMVLRSLHDLSEYELLRREFETLSDGERDALLAARKTHKEQVVFLHEWAHTLGLTHVRRPAGIMNPAYASGQSGFDEVEARMIEAALERRRDQAGPWRRDSASDLLAIAREAPDGDWDPRDRQLLIAILDAASHDRYARAGSRPAPATMTPVTTPVTTTPVTTTPAPSEPLSAAERAACADAVKLARAGKPDDAMHRLGPVEAKHPRAPEVRLAACELMWLRPAGPARAALVDVACSAAAELAPRDAHPQLFLADADTDAGSFDKAVPALLRARQLLDGSDDTTAWRLLATLLERAQFPTLAQEAAAHADAATAQKVAARAQATRWRAGLPRGVVPAERERDFLLAVAAARAAVGTATETRAIESAARQFPVAGARLRCEAALRHDDVAAARVACDPLLAPAPTATLQQMRADFSARYER